MHSIVASSEYHVTAASISGRIGAQELGALDLENAGEGIDEFGVAARANERPVCGPGLPI
jgi:hypothetical protein